ncbi:hypothetical protein RGQ15_19680 [Paracoccus sp. MBLB3053]|uniref:Uncharacterized protein n=1 Tax=Paracoccus aurantius TaxID=3073814 RepID=A0ABU2HXJ8_9RHOB|nr:hypothetical protein [Paracoccus sp. MBLB3053]MDS9469783.1 hypothetical protein [Paracoccus sp. MBLB3053]
MPTTCGFVWGPGPALAYAPAIALLSGGLAWRGRFIPAMVLLIAAGVLKVGIARLAWPFVLFAVASLGWAAAARSSP